MSLFEEPFRDASASKPPPVPPMINKSRPVPPIIKPPVLPVNDSRSQKAQRVYDEGVRLRDAGQAYEALKVFLTATEIDPNCVDACVALARGFHAADSVKYSDQVLQLGEQAFRSAPSDPRACNIASVANFEKGKIAMEREDWAEAVKYFERAYQIEPTDRQTFSVLGYCAAKADMRGKFVDICEEHLKTQPDDHPVRYALGRNLVKMAIASPSAPDMRWMQADLLRSAEDHLKAFLTTEPHSCDGNFQLGIVYIMTGRIAQANEIVARLQATDPSKSKELKELLSD